VETDGTGSDHRRAGESGVYQLATLVRTVVFIGAAADNLSEALTLHLNTPATLHRTSGACISGGPLDEPEHLQTELLEKYRRATGEPSRLPR